MIEIQKTILKTKTLVLDYVRGGEGKVLDWHLVDQDMETAEKNSYSGKSVNIRETIRSIVSEANQARPRN